MNIDLDQRRFADGLEAVNFAGLDDKNVAGTALKGFAVHSPKPTTFPHELDFIVGMPMRAGALARLGAKEEHGDVYVAVLGSDEFVRAAYERQVLLTDVVHLDPPKSCKKGFLVFRILSRELPFAAANSLV